MANGKTAPESGKGGRIDDEAVVRFELLISRLLSAGVWLSLALMVIGMVLMFRHHPEYFRSSEGLAALTNPTAAQVATPGAVARGAREFSGRMWIAMGLLFLIATPVLRVAVSIVVFARQRDRAYVIITSLVLALLLLSFALGKTG